MLKFLRRLTTGVLIVLAIGVAVLWVRSLTSADALVASRRGVTRGLWSVNGRLIAEFEYTPPSDAPLKWSYIRVPDVAMPNPMTRATIGTIQGQFAPPATQAFSTSVVAKPSVPSAFRTYPSPSAAIDTDALTLDPAAARAAPSAKGDARTFSLSTGTGAGAASIVSPATSTGTSTIEFGGRGGASPAGSAPLGGGELVMVRGILTSRRAPETYVCRHSTAIAALLLPALLLNTPTLWRRHVRRRRRKSGLCVSCGYDLRGVPNDTCPECGTANLIRRDLVTADERR